MDLNHAFELSVPVDRAWHLLTDLERVAPCLPGARLEGIDGDAYRGVMTVQAGPVTARFRGRVTVVERDDHARRLVLEAQGEHLGGDGRARATVGAMLRQVGDRTRVEVTIGLSFAGPVGRLDWATHARIAGGLVERFAGSVDRLAAGDEPVPAPLGLPALVAPGLRRLVGPLLAVTAAVALVGGVRLTRRRRRGWGKMATPG
jgi:carbon monoxide dehydrogenase subunit G